MPDSAPIRQVPNYYCRLTIHLPIKTPELKLATKEIIDDLKTEFNGSTFVDTDKSVFTGTWVDGAGQPVIEPITIFIVDIPYDYFDLKRENWSNKEVWKNVENIKKRVAEIYDDNGCHQDEIWINIAPSTILQTIKLSS